MSSCCCSTSPRPVSTRSWRRSSARCIVEERQRGRTVLLSSHILGEVEAVCDRVTIVRAGRAVESGTLAELRHLRRTAISAELARPPADWPDLPGVYNLHLEGNRLRCEVDAAALDDLLRRLTAVGLLSLVSQPPTLEELFLSHYQVEPSRPTGAADQRAGVGR